MASTSAPVHTVIAEAPSPTTSSKNAELQTQLDDLFIKTRHIASLGSTGSLSLNRSMSADLINAIVIQKDSFDNDDDDDNEQATTDDDVEQQQNKNDSNSTSDNSNSSSSSAKRVAFSENNDVHEIPRIGNKSAAAIHKTKTRNNSSDTDTGSDERGVSCRDVIGVLGARLLGHVFAAVMPTTSAKDEDYYDRLQITEYASVRKIHRAFETKLAQLVFSSAQQHEEGNMDDGDSLAQFHRLRSAYECLKDSHSRRIYDGLRQSPTKYQFIRSGACLDPNKLYKNLAKATMAKRIRLFIVMVFVLGLVLLTPIGSAVKVNHILEGSDKDIGWVVLFLPLWCLQTLYFLWTLLYAFLVPQDEQEPKGRLVIRTTISAFAQICLFAGELFLTKQWDESLDASYGAAFAPIYYGLGFHILGLIHKMYGHKYDAARMVTWSYLQGTLLKGRDFASLSKNDQVKFRSYYILVKPASASEIEGIESAQDEEDLERLRVMSTPEFEEAMESFYESLGSIMKAFFFLLPLLTLIYQKVESNIRASWFVVFVPLWIMLGLKLLSHSREICKSVKTSGAAQVSSNAVAQETTKDIENNKCDEETASIKGGDEASLKSNKSAANLSLGSSDSGRDKIIVLPKEPPSVVTMVSKALSSFLPTPEIDQSSNDQIANDQVQEEEFETIYVINQAEVDPKEVELANQAMAARSRAWSNFFFVFLQLWMSLMLVAKLEQAYETEDGGFNALWVISPLVALANFAFCIITLIIFGANGR